MPRKSLPKYCLHKASGLAYVKLDGKRCYLGRHGSAESHKKYTRRIADWQSALESPPSELSVGELTLLYLEFCQRHYRKNGEPTTEVQTIRDALVRLNRQHRHTRVDEFSPRMLKAVRTTMVDAGLARTTINGAVGRIRRMFRWAVSEELVPSTVLLGLEAVGDLRRGRSEAREPEPVLPVPKEHIFAIEAFVPPPVWGMIQFQLWTGARPSEARMVRSRDLRMSGDVWEYIPPVHKTEHHGKGRVIFIGERGQEVIQEFLNTNLDAYIFSPLGSNGARPYRRDSYRTAVQRACRRAGIPAWTPNQLRHNFATEARRHAGIEAACVVLGHASAVTSEIYAERDLDAARSVARQIG